MDINTYNRAKYLKEKIDHISVKMTQVQRMQKREDDDDFNVCRELAYDALNDAKLRYEQDFNAL